MKAAIYNSYLDSLGGGERYTMAVATSLRHLGYQVDLEWNDPKIVAKIESRFGISLKDIAVKDNINRGDGYDLCFWVSDGSVPLLRSRKNILHFQIPFKNVNGSSLINRMKMQRIKHVVCNSKFTKRFIDKEYSIVSDVLYPPVDVENIKPKRKENVILYVGRFSQLTQAKNQHLLIDVFKKICKKDLERWKLVLIGGSEVGAGEYLAMLRKNSEGYPIEILESTTFKEIQKYYGKAKIFWSASGYGVNESKDPKAVEHFGITVVEAMAAGAVPIVVAKGGHREIITNGVNGLLWKTPNMLGKLTLDLIESKKYSDFTQNMLMESKKYSYEHFSKSFTEIIGRK